MVSKRLDPPLCPVLLEPCMNGCSREKFNECLRIVDQMTGDESPVLRHDNEGDEYR